MDEVSTPSNRIKAWQESTLGNTLFLRADYRHQTFERHYHDEYAIGVMQRGCQVFIYDRNTRLDMPGGTVALISPGVVHSGRPHNESGWLYRMLYPEKALVEQAIVDIFGSGKDVIFNAPVVADDSLFAELENLHRASEINRDPIEIESRFLRCVKLAFQRHAGVKNPVKGALDRPGLMLARDYIHQSTQRTLRLSELADVAGLSRCEFIRQFKAAFGLTPYAYVKHVRVNKAREYILCGGALSESAAIMGFSDQAHMTRSFRSTFGYTPGQLASSMQN